MKHPAPALEWVSDELIERAERDPHRPRFHFVAPAGWLNDPNGVGQWNGTYHLFYQHNPEGAVHHRIHWGHATSTDLLHWHHEPIALTPSAGPDAEGCWSGVLVDDDGTPTLVYSGHAPQLGRTQNCCVATGDTDLQRWRKAPGNPVIPGAPTGLQVSELRDHTVWRDGDRWHQAMGSGLIGAGGALLHFSGPSVRDWSYQGVLLDARDVPPGDVFAGTTWECPDLFRLAGQAADERVLVFSAWHEGMTLYPLYLTGRLAEGRLVADGPPRHLDHGLRHFYAPQSFTAQDGRRIQFGWAQEARPDEAAVEAGWSGVMSLPRTLTLATTGRVLTAPVEEIAELRVGAGEHFTVSQGDRWARTRADQLDLTAKVTLPIGGQAELALRATADLHEATVLRLERLADGTVRMSLNRSRSRAPAEAADYDVTELSGSLPSAPNERIDLRVLVDHSILEVFADGVPLTARVYPSRGDAQGVRASVIGGASAALSVWTMRNS